MATNMKSNLTYPFVLFFLLGALLISSCGGGTTIGKDEVCIKNPKDTSDLGKRKHFIPVMSIDIYKKDFHGQRDSIVKKNPDIFIPDYEIFNRTSIVKYLEDSTVVGFKFYYGVKPGGEKRKALRLMIVGVDKNGKDVYIKDNNGALGAQATNDEGGLEYGQCNPPCDIEP
ncbi:MULTISPECIES: hypothetical protein [Niastella]|uniref:Lipoprotein n=1 Tax=Niastella soli TaxID=2821487 RepID=A0ABS3YQE9_9BACT|nr:hypothetical protein [Niastella soli]MBO9200117.1 hypothetical protein [Niastella soli]